MSLLIISDELDVHARALKWAYDKAGLDCVLFTPGDAPHNLRLSMLFPSASNHPTPNILIDGRPLDEFEFCWIRKPSRPNNYSSNLHKSDIPMAAEQVRRALESIYHQVDLSTKCVNPYHTRAFVNSKPQQLAKAREAGFKIPQTLITNDPAELDKFINAHPRVVYKTLAPAFWHSLDSGMMYGAFTSEITPESLRNPESVINCPGIYQERIEKKFEYRVVFFGDTYFVVRIDSQTSDISAQDWRADMNLEHCILKESSIPEHVAVSCKKLMQLLGILHGSFDLIEDENGDFVFLEINECGQFLWLERVLPELPLLDAAFQFSLNVSETFKYSPNASSVFLSDYEKTSDYADFLSSFQAFSAVKNSIPFNYME